MSRFLITIALIAVGLLIAVDVSQSHLPADVSYDTVDLRDNLTNTQHVLSYAAFEWAEWEVTDYGVVRFAQNGDTVLVADPITGKWHSWR